MTDRDLLMDAAKAAGIDVFWWPADDPVALRLKRNNDLWNPLTDDGDALRLAVRLRITPHIDGSMTEAEAATRSEGGFFAEPHLGDPYAATRRAIVRAAAVYAPDTQDDTAVCADVIDPVTQEPSEANARRIVASVNACEGMRTEDLENITMLGDTIASRFKERDRIEIELEGKIKVLLEALRDIGEYTGEGPRHSAPWQDIVTSIGKTARAAIAKATGGAE